MGLNLSRGKPTNTIRAINLYCGLLTFMTSSINDIFSKDEIIFYDNILDLADKIKFY